MRNVSICPIILFIQKNVNICRTWFGQQSWLRPPVEFFFKGGFFNSSHLKATTKSIFFILKIVKTYMIMFKLALFFFFVFWFFNENIFTIKMTLLGMMNEIWNQFKKFFRGNRKHECARTTIHTRHFLYRFSSYFFFYS